MGIEPREERNADDLRRAAMNKPTHIDPRAERVLSLLAGRPEAAEIVLGGKKEFSFQISARSVGLEEPVASAWPPVLIETIVDNIASKMNALVDRGAPRDFTDVKHVVDEGLVAVSGAWGLWARKNPDEPLESAKQKVLLHLAGFEGRRPLEAIRDVAERERAQIVRAWFKQEFLAR